MTRLVDILDSLNRKERYALVCDALGLSSFTPSYGFVARLLERCQVSVSGPSTAVCWMDYHLDWLYAGLVIDKADEVPTAFPSPEFPGIDGAFLNVNANQEDVDLLVVVTAAEATHLFFVEAKWESSWSTSQAVSKLRRLQRIFGDDGSTYPGVMPHLVLASTATPTQLLKRINSADPALPAEWMLVDDQLARIELVVPSGRRRIFRCSEDLVESKVGSYWSFKQQA